MKKADPKNLPVCKNLDLLQIPELAIARGGADARRVELDH